MILLYISKSVVIYVSRRLKLTTSHYSMKKSFCKYWQKVLFDHENRKTILINLLTILIKRRAAVIVHSTDFKTNLGKYLDRSKDEDIFILRDGNPRQKIQNILI